MGVQVKTGSFTTPASGTTVVTGLGFTPAAIIFWTDYDTTANQWHNDSYASLGFGAYDGTNYTNAASCYTGANNQGAGTYKTGYGDISTKCVYAVNTGGTVVLSGALTAVASGQFTITWTTTSANYIVHYLAIGGNVTKGYVKTWAQPTSAGNKAITGVGFTPSAVLHLGVNFTADAHGYYDYSGGRSLDFLIGAMDGTNQWGSGTSTFSYWDSNYYNYYAYRGQLTSAGIVAVKAAAASGSFPYQATWVSFGADGFTVNYASGHVATGATQIHSLCLYDATGSEISVGSWAKTTSGNGSTDTVTTGITNAITGAFFVSDANTASASVAAGGRLTMGGDDGTSHDCIVMSDYNAANDISKDYSGNYNDRSTNIANNDTKTNQSYGYITTLGTGNFVYTWTTSAATATQICYVAFGSSVTNATVTLTTVPNCTTAPAAITPKITLTMSVPACTTATDTVTALVVQNRTVVFPQPPPECTTESAAGAITITVLISAPECATHTGGTAVSYLYAGASIDAEAEVAGGLAFGYSSVSITGSAITAAVTDTAGGKAVGPTVITTLYGGTVDAEADVAGGVPFNSVLVAETVAIDDTSGVEVGFESEETSTISTQEEVLPEAVAEEALVFDLSELSGSRDLVSKGRDTYVLNFGDAGTDYHAWAVQNDYITLPSGASAWVLSGDDRDNDYIAIPRGAAVDNLHDLTFEWLVYFNGVMGNNQGRLWSKQQHQHGYFDVYVDASEGENRIVISRATIYDLDEWKTPVDSVNTGIWNYIQISWASAEGASGTIPTSESIPNVYINNEVQVIEQTRYGNGLWADDSYSDAIIGNVLPDGGYSINATVAVFRVYATANSRGVCKSNYLADLWRTHDPKTGALVIPSDAIQADTDPLLRIGKNLSSIDVQFDYSSIVTQLYPRGTGQSPSELRLDNPPYYPPATPLQFLNSDSNWAYFLVPGKYSCYNGWAGVGTVLPQGMYVSKGLGDVMVVGTDPSTYADPLPLPFGATHWMVGQIFQYSKPFQIYWVELFIKRKEGAQTPGQVSSSKEGKIPRMIVGVYTTTGGTVNRQYGQNVYVPYQGPIVWNIADVRTIPTDDYHWIRFPMQAHKFDAGVYSLVISNYPETEEWETGGLLFNMNPTHPGGWTCLVGEGHTPGAWNEYGIPNTTTADSIAMRIQVAGVDVSSQFWQSGALWPGRQVKTALSNYSPSTDYWVHYPHAPYLRGWDEFFKYGKIEGTYKNDAMCSHDALVKAATNYLETISQPVMTLSLSAADLYDLNPTVNWNEELVLGGQVTISDEVLGFEQTCIISKITKPNLNTPHDIQLQLDNVHPNAQKLLARLSSAHQTMPKYLQGQTVATPYSGTITGASSTTPQIIYVEIRDVASIVHAVTLDVLPTVTTASGQEALFSLSVDDTVVK